MNNNLNNNYNKICKDKITIKKNKYSKTINYKNHSLFKIKFKMTMKRKNKEMENNIISNNNKKIMRIMIANYIS